MVRLGNRALESAGISLFEVEGADEEDFDAWNNRERIQVLYTLVRVVP